MQQTQTYKLNLLETSDAFSPSPLNENMEKVETKLAALDGADAAEAAARQALDQRVTALEVQKIYFGTYLSTGDDTIDLGVTPVAVFVQSRQVTQGSGIAIGEKFGTYHNGSGQSLVIIPNGFRVIHDSYFSIAGKEFSYIAFV